jgi:two-component system response regulator MprA
MTAHRHQVLIVDDDEDVREALAAFLTACGDEAIAAVDGIEGLAKLAAGIDICLVLLDVRMPRLDGWAFREAQLANPALAGVPVVIVTGDGPGHQARANTLGVCQLLTKPVDPGNLRTAIDRHCRPAGARTIRPPRY